MILWWGFDVLLREQMGGGFAEKWSKVKCVPEDSYMVCYFFLWMSYHTNNSM